MAHPAELTPNGFKGNCTRQEFTKTQIGEEDLTLDLADVDFGECCFQLNVFADVTGDRFKNDISSVLYFVNESISSSEIFLEKLDASGLWVDVVQLVDNTYGINFPLGFDKNRFNEDLHGFQIQWNKVLNLEGVGCYRIRHEYQELIGPIAIEYSFEYTLQQYSSGIVDGTVRLDFITSGTMGDVEKDTIVRHFGKTNWVDQIRLEGFFGIPDGNFSREFVRFQNGKMKTISDNMADTYSLEIDQAPFSILEFLKKRVMQSDVSVTDYNSKNQGKFIEKAVNLLGNFEPVWTSGAKLAPVWLSMEQSIQNNKHLNC